MVFLKALSVISLTFLATIYLTTGQVPDNTIDLDFTCSSAGELEGCVLCAADCLYVHNSWGGVCGPNKRNASLNTCYCNYTAPLNSRSFDPYQNIKDTCANYSLGALEDTQINANIIILADFLAIFLCAPVPPQNKIYGCQMDCYNHHGQLTGTCEKATSVFNSSNTQTFCECSGSYYTTTSAPATNLSGILNGLG